MLSMGFIGMHLLYISDGLWIGKTQFIQKSIIPISFYAIPLYKFYYDYNY